MTNNPCVKCRWCVSTDDRPMNRKTENSFDCCSPALKANDPNHIIGIYGLRLCCNVRGKEDCEYFERKIELQISIPVKSTGDNHGVQQ